jgi:hypothetical protein
MAEEANQDAGVEITTDIFAEEETTSAPESSPEETKPQAEAKAEEPAAETETEGEAEPEGDESSSDEAETEETETEQPKKGAEVRIRQLVAQNHQMQETIKDLTAKVYRAQTPQEILAADEDGTVSPEMAEIQSLKEERQISDWTNHVTNLNTRLEAEANLILRDYPEFDPSSDSFDEGLSTKAQSLYLRAAAMETDPNTGLVVNANLTPYEIYQTLAEARRDAVKTGEVKGQKASDKMLAAADTTSVAAPKPVKKDPLLALWED